MSEKALGQLRHAIGLFVGYAVGKGWFGDELGGAVISIVMALVPCVWSWAAKKGAVPPAVPILLLAILPIGFGCASLETTAYRTIGTTTTLVDSSMKAWSDYVVHAKVSEAKQEPVRNAYGKYQVAMAAVKVAVISVKATPDGKSNLDKALDALSASSAELIVLIHALTTSQ